MDKFEKAALTAKELAIYSFALPLGIFTVQLSWILADYMVFGTTSPVLGQMTLENYGSWLISLLGIYLLLLFIPKAFIYFKGSGKQRYKFLIYFLLPILTWLFLPGIHLVLVAWTIIASAAYIEAIAIVRRKR